MNRKIVLTVMLLAVALSLAAQRSMLADTGWDSMSTDSVRPWCSFGLELDGNWQDSVYSVSIEYPELEQIDALELKRWNLSMGALTVWPNVESNIALSHGRATLNAGFVPIIRRDGACWAIRSCKWIVQAGAKPSKTPLRSIEQRYTHNSVLNDGSWVKIRIANTGIYKLTYSALRKMGFKNPKEVRLYGYGGALLPESNIHELTDDLPEQPLWRGSDYMLFYGQGPQSWSLNNGIYEHKVNTYSDWGYYFLTERTDSVCQDFTLLQTDSVEGTMVTTYPDYTVYDPDEFSWYRSGRRFFEAFDYAQVNSCSYSFGIEGIIADTVDVQIAFSTSSNVPTKVNAYVNDAKIGTLYLSENDSHEVASVGESMFVSLGEFKEYNNIKLVHDRPFGVSGHLDYIRLNYRRKLALYGSNTLFRVDSQIHDVSFCVTNSNPHVQIWRLSGSGEADIVPSLYSNGCTTTYASSYSPSDILVAVDVEGRFPEPVVDGVVQNQNLHAMDSVDMVIVVPASGKLTAQAERLALAHSQFDNIKTAVVRADMIYNEFSSGTPDATAIRRFMKMLYDRGGNSSAPRYLLLMGNGAWDNRMHTQEWKGENPNDWLLCYESYNSTSHTQSFVMEDYFGLLDDNEGVSLLTEMTDLGVGRIPVSSAAQAQVMVDRLIDYMRGTYSGVWNNRILVLGDDGDNNTHMVDADYVAGIYGQVSPAMDVQKVYWDAFNMEATSSYNGYPAVRKLLLDELREGALIVNYSGHGSTEVLSHELVLSKADMGTLKSNHLPFWITASCDIAPFDSRTESLGMNLFNNTGGGAIGMLTTTRTVYAIHNAKMNRAFSKHLLSRSSDGRLNTVGDALRLAKNELLTGGKEFFDNSENKLHFVLLGDPALRLAAANMTAVVDMFNDTTTTITGSAQAGSVITVSGHIECNGMPVPNFQGLLWSTVYDNEQLVTCRNNLGTAKAPFEYIARDKILFSGTDSVRNGKFSFSFPVPMDINYSGDSGRIVLFASSQDGLCANGTYTNFTVGGTADGLIPDTIGPSIDLYLNTPMFQYGAKVNSTPLLVAELSDSSGLNTSGNGIGHDILLVIDNNPEWTWVLNSHFEQNQSDYTGGKVMFAIPELPEGRHELMFRAWDVMNNPTTLYLGFKVVSDLKPSFSIDVTNSPARDNTTFVITHDRPGQDALITLQVTDSNGMLQWTESLRDESQSGVVMVDWNLTSSSGHRLNPGLYIARASVQSGNAPSAIASCKFVVLGP